MFEGFKQATIDYYEALRRENSKKVHKENELLYLEGVKEPIEQLYFELYHYFQNKDSELLSNKRKCISTAYNDARFSKDAPIKEYMYLRFKLDTPNKKNALGFFFDVSLDGYRYGLNIYNMDAKGMEKIRDYILDNKHYAKRVIEEFNEAGLLEVRGETYKRAYYAEEKEVLREWLERKKLYFVHEEKLSDIFYKREILECMLAAFDSVYDVYLMLKEAL